ncbi:MAG: hypothetical protein MHM6MM_002165 [Cercozoa sp. M6MM]
MKFEARADGTVMGYFADVAHALRSAGVQKVLLSGTEGGVGLLASSALTNGDHQVFVRIKKSFFSLYKIESNRDKNRINMEVSVSNICAGMKHARNQSLRKTEWRLVKDIETNAPVLKLSFFINKDDESDAVVRVPVLLDSSGESHLQYEEPNLPPPIERVCCPNYEMLKNSLDRMRTVSDRVLVEFDTEVGELKLEAKGELVQLGVKFTNLKVEGSARSNEDDEECCFATVHTVDLQRLAQCFAAFDTTISRIVLVEDMCVTGIARNEWFMLTFYVPLLACDD